MTEELNKTITNFCKGINFPDYLDAHEDRKKALEKVRDRIFALALWRNECLNDDHPVRRKQNEDELKQVGEELCWRFQDYDAFMYDFQKDWDLNYQDYGLDKVYEKEWP